VVVQRNRGGGMQRRAWGCDEGVKKWGVWRGVRPSRAC
jgi:hypothetical protein